jgi:hypothetical protein
MAWTVWGEILETADIAASPSKRVYLKARINQDSVLIAMRTWFIMYGDPTFTSLTMDIFSNNEQTGLPSTKIMESTTVWTKAQLLTLAHGVKGMQFKFDDFMAQTGTFYHFIPRAVGYTGSASSHIAWRKAWPDPTYRTNLSSGYGKLGVAPYSAAFIGARL